jgi:cytochrome bd-type quinol oxidase subunit 2
MATGQHAQSRTIAGASRLGLGATLVALAGIGLVGYGTMFLIRNFAGFIELGLTAEHVGGTPQEIRAFSPDLYQYISHLQVAVSGFIVALGVAVIALAWYGIRKGERWALWTAFLSPVIAVAIALPLHFPYGLATLGHLGPIYLVALILAAGTALAYTGLRRVRR